MSSGIAGQRCVAAQSRILGTVQVCSVWIYGVLDRVLVVYLLFSIYIEDLRVRSQILLQNGSGSGRDQLRHFAGRIVLVAENPSMSWT